MMEIPRVLKRASVARATMTVLASLRSMLVTVAARFLASTSWA